MIEIVYVGANMENLSTLINTRDIYDVSYFRRSKNEKEILSR